MTDQETALVRTDAGAIEALMSQAVAKGLDADSMSKLFALYERMDARQAAKDFADALAAFQNECPAIKKRAQARFQTKAGWMHYNYAPLEDIVAVARPLLHRHGLAFGWDQSVSEGRLKVICTVRHVNGHSETASFESDVDRGNKALSAAQCHAQALTFGQRRSLTSVLGIVTTDEDTDAASDETITEEQCSEIQERLEAITAITDEPVTGLFLSYMHAERIDCILAHDFDKAITALSAKMRSVMTANANSMAEDIERPMEPMDPSAEGRQKTVFEP